ncbi:MAG: hypothetical protein ACYDIE_12610 [Candidatus Krumholzibacteriia bacterium]
MRAEDPAFPARSRLAATVILALALAGAGCSEAPTRAPGETTLPGGGAPGLDRLAPTTGNVTGRVILPDGSPVAGATVRVGAGRRGSGATRPDGSFSLWTDPGDTAYVLAVTDDDRPGTIGALYDFAGGPYRRGRTAGHLVTMIPNDPLTAGCAGSNPGGLPGCVPLPDDHGFMWTFRLLTYTLFAGNNTILYSWAAYPVTFWVEDRANGYGFDLGALAREAAAAWNGASGRALFTETADSAAARLLVRWSGTLPSNYFGLTQITAPHPVGSHYGLDTVVPERMEILIREDLRIESTLRGVVPHEFGHALGFGIHSGCDAHLMKFGALPIPAGTPMAAAISADEALAARLIARLPSGLDLRCYRLE